MTTLLLRRWSSFRRSPSNPCEPTVAVRASALLRSTSRAIGSGRRQVGGGTPFRESGHGDESAGNSKRRKRVGGHKDGSSGAPPRLPRQDVSVPAVQHPVRLDVSHPEDRR